MHANLKNDILISMRKPEARLGERLSHVIRESRSWSWPVIWPQITGFSLSIGLLLDLDVCKLRVYG